MRIFLTAFIFFYVASALSAEGEMLYLYHPPESPNDTRYNYHWEILKSALEATKDKFGSYALKPSYIMTEDRQIEEMKKGTKSLTVMIRETSIDNEQKMEPVRIPIDKNLISWRVYLINKKKRKAFQQVKTLDDLKKLTVGQGKGWGDVPILQKAGFKVITEIDYEYLFQRLAKGNFDGFPRSITEVLSEYEQRKKECPGMEIEKNILLYYPLPTYFWFTKDAQGKRMAERVKIGMKRLIANGTYDRIFNKYFSDSIEILALKNRKIFKIANPFLPNTKMDVDQSFIFDPISN